MRILKTNGVRGMAQLFGKKLSKHLIQWSLVIAGALLWGQNWKIFELAFQPLFWFITPAVILAAIMFYLCFYLYKWWN